MKIDKISFLLYIDNYVRLEGQKKEFTMNLKEYLFYKDMSVKEFAKQAGFHETYMSAIMNKKRAASKKALKLIEFATGGWVKQDTVFQETKLPEGFKADVLPFPETEPESEDEPIEKIALGS